MLINIKSDYQLMKFSFGSERNELKKFEELSLDERSIVFYSENENSMLIFESLIDELTTIHDMDICYVTSSKNELSLMKSKNRVKTFYIGDGIVRTKFFLNLKAKIMIMTMPDLETFHIKRSKVYPVHYVYMFHSMVSTHLVYQKSAFDNFDTILCVGDYQIQEIRNTEKEYNLKPKNLIKFGYSHLDNLLEKYPQENFGSKDNTNVLLAPSWGKDGIFETISEDIIEILLKNKYKVTLRPHPMSQKKSKKKIEKIKKRFSNQDDFIFEDNILNFDSFFSSSLMITDWSGSALEFSFAFKKPVIFIDVPKKTNNPEFEKISLIPIEVSIREKIGKILFPSNLDLLPNEIEMLISQTKKNQPKLLEIRNRTIFHVNESKKFGAESIVELLNKNL
tara:strand:+ start:176 stop:1354 length:1179 start_codon:yes stop_codon:yes gene_type:complete